MSPGLDIEAVEEDVKRCPYLVGIDMDITVEIGIYDFSADIKPENNQYHAKHGSCYYLLAVDLAFALPQDLFYVFLLVVRAVGEILHVCGNCYMLVSIVTESSGISRQKRSTDSSVRNFCKSAIQQSLRYWKSMNFSQHER